MSSKFLIRGGVVLTMGARTPNHTEADVLIEGDRIAEIGPGLRARDAEVVDASESVVMPGFVDTHRHAWRSLFRNVGMGTDELSSSALAPHFTVDDCYAATLIGLLGAVEAGVTTVVDCFDLRSESGYAEACLQAHADSGLRTVFVSDKPERFVDPTPIATGRSPGLTSFAFGPSSAAEDWEAARRAGYRIHAHVGSQAGDAGSVAELGKRGLLGPDVTLIHCTNLNDDDLDAIASSGAGVGIAPSVEMAAGIGLPPMQRLIDRDIRPGLAVDNEHLSPGDIFAQMRAVISMQHASYFDLKLAGKAGLPNLLNTRETIRYATVHGARVAGVGDVAGTLEPGKQADVIVLRTDRPNLWPVNDPIGAVVWGMDTSNLDRVFVAGRPLMVDGALVADVRGARELAEAARGRVGASSGLLAGVGGAG